MTAATPPQQHGLLLLDKPSGPTSFGCLNQIKRKLGQKKIGHAGTLDPLASGLLLVMLGRGTKIAGYLQDGRKTYRGTLRLGLTTDTWDIQGEVTAESDVSGLDPDQVRQAVLDWTAETMQEVPAYSAAKVQGKPMHALARAGKETPERTKAVTIYESQVLHMDLPDVEFRVVCSRGTYVRSLVHSLGSRLMCGAVLTELVREGSSPFTLDAAHGLDEVLADPDGFPGRVLPLEEALPHWPRTTLVKAFAQQVRNGGRLPTRITPELPADPGSRALFLDDEGGALALVESVQQGDETVWAILRGLW